jgi:hypothetical protein
MTPEEPRNRESAKNGPPLRTAVTNGLEIDGVPILPRVFPFHHKNRKTICLHRLIEILTHRLSSHCSSPKRVREATRMRTLSLILVFLSALRLSSADVPRSIHKTCASKVMKKCKCKDWKCIDQAMQNSCAVPKSTERRRRYMRLVRSHVRHAYCDPTPLPTAISGMCLVHESTFGCGKRVFDQSCESVIDSYEWLSGNCCSLKDHGDGSCMLTVDGPGEGRRELLHLHDVQSKQRRVSEVPVQGPRSRYVENERLGSGREECSHAVIVCGVWSIQCGRSAYVSL